MYCRFAISLGLKNPNYSHYGVSRLWSQLRNQHAYVEFIDRNYPMHGAGVGVSDSLPERFGTKHC
jgi:hypothetical protein